MITVTIKTILHLKSILGAASRITLPDGSTLEALLKQMVDQWGETLRSQIFQSGTETPLPRIRLLINGRDIAFLDGLQTPLQDSDEVLIMPPVAGG